MSETVPLGQRDRRGDWRPAKLLSPPPLFVWPPRPRALLRWLFGYPGYVLPWNLLYVAIATLTWQFLTPDLARMRVLAPGWIGEVFARNLALLVLVCGAWHVRLYVQQRQGVEYKFTSRWQATGNSAFVFRNQVLDNVFWSLVSGVPIWTAFEVVTFWGQANGWLPSMSWAEHPLYGAALMLAIPVWRELHFYLIHRLIHWPPLYRAVHSLHHNNVNPGPWSGLAMHPVEHVLYFSGVLLHWVLPSNGLHVVFHLQHLAFSPAQGHTGFEKVVLASGATVDTGGFMHYLHHRYFEVNYGSELVPLDKWFGTMHDGSRKADDAMNARLRRRADG
jgi:sterol desaturase/sphingolipid hydroxylase (fatty acid hydroxylase superfamily)